MVTITNINIAPAGLFDDTDLKVSTEVDPAMNRVRSATHAAHAVTFILMWVAEEHIAAIVESAAWEKGVLVRPDCSIRRRFVQRPNPSKRPCWWRLMQSRPLSPIARSVLRALKEVQTQHGVCTLLKRQKDDCGVEHRSKVISERVDFELATLQT